MSVLPFVARPRSGLLLRTAAVLLLALQGLPAAAVTIDFRNAPAGARGHGNSIFVQGADGTGVTAYAFAETGAESPVGSGYFGFETAEIWSWGTGLGICNRTEGRAASGCDSNEHEVDTAGRDDLVVLFFSRPVAFRELTVLPYDGPYSDPNDRDIAYWVGNVAGLPDFSASTFASLGLLPGFSGPVFSPASAGFSPYTHSLGGTGNVLLLSGDFRIRDCLKATSSQDVACESWKFTSITVDPAVVPLPAGAWLFGPALGALALLRRRRPAR